MKSGEKQEQWAHQRYCSHPQSPGSQCSRMEKVCTTELQHNHCYRERPGAATPLFPTLTWEPAPGGGEGGSALAPNHPPSPQAYAQTGSRNTSLILTHRKQELGVFLSLHFPCSSLLWIKPSALKSIKQTNMDKKCWSVLYIQASISVYHT